MTVPVKDYDLIINDFEPVSAWACKLRGVKCFSLSRQFALRNNKHITNKKTKFLQNLILRYFAPSEHGIGFDYNKDISNNFYPIIKSELKNVKINEENHFTVYLPSYSINNITNFFLNIDLSLIHI